MKKQLLFLAMMFLTAGAFAQMTKPLPIPTFNAEVVSCSFFEEVFSTSTSFTDGKKNLTVVRKVNSADNLQVSRVWFYSTDQSTIIGPCLLFPNSTISQEVDGRAWGVMIQTDNPIVVDVLIQSAEISPALGIAR